MPKRNDIKSVLIIGQDPLLLVKVVNLIIQALEPVEHSGRRL